MFYNFFKFIVGFLLAIIIMAGASLAAALYFAAKLTALPEKPVFPNDKPLKKTPDKNQKKVASKPASIPSPKGNETPSIKPLEPGAYRAMVIQPIGLVIRENPNQDGNRLGGVSYREEVIVLEETSDKKWQRVRLPEGDLQGWIKGGNIEPLSEVTDNSTNNKTPGETP